MKDDGNDSKARRSSSDRQEESSRQWDDRALERAYAVVWVLARRFAAGGIDAEDLAQECMIKVVRGASRCAEWPLPKAWVRKVATNCCIDHIESDRPRRRFERSVDVSDLKEIPDTGPLPDEACHASQRRAAVEKALTGLSAEQREALQIVLLEDRSCREAARSMGVSRSVVDRAVRQGILHLKAAGILAAWVNEASNPSYRDSESEFGRPLVVCHRDRHVLTSLQYALKSETLSCLLTGMRIARGLAEVEECVRRHAGCPIIVDPALFADRRPDFDALWKPSLGEAASGIVVYAPSERAWPRERRTNGGDPALVLVKGVDDDPFRIQDTILRAIDQGETENLVSRAKTRTPSDVHRLIKTVFRMSVRPITVGLIANTMGISRQAVRKQCRTHGLPAPKRLLDLLVVYHVERLAQWSRRPSKTVAIAVGFEEGSDYERTTRRILDESPSEVREAGGSAHVARVVLRRIGPDHPAETE